MKYRIIVIEYKQLFFSTAEDYNNNYYHVILLIDTFGFGSQYEGDILFLEDDIELSKDAIKMIWYMLGIKNSHYKTVGVGLGGWSGENLINPHPDTVVIRYVVMIMAYILQR